VRSTGNINSPAPEEFQPDQNYCEPELKTRSWEGNPFEAMKKINYI
jgi:hypothetical protein